eukprot:1556531-Pyramimonas_sp.AAC.1
MEDPTAAEAAAGAEEAPKEGYDKWAKTETAIHPPQDPSEAAVAATEGAHDNVFNNGNDNDNDNEDMRATESARHHTQAEALVHMLVVWAAAAAAIGATAALQARRDLYQVSEASKTRGRFSATLRDASGLRGMCWDGCEGRFEGWAGCEVILVFSTHRGSSLRLRRRTHNRR